jgi:hypothetical protein
MNGHVKPTRFRLPERRHVQPVLQVFATRLEESGAVLVRSEERAAPGAAALSTSLVQFGPEEPQLLPAVVVRPQKLLLGVVQVLFFDVGRDRRLDDEGAEVDRPHFQPQVHTVGIYPTHINQTFHPKLVDSLAVIVLLRLPHHLPDAHAVYDATEPRTDLLPVQVAIRQSNR